MINAPVILRTFLVAQPTLFTLTGNRIWEQRVVPIKGYDISQGEAICFRTRGGRLDYTGNLLTNSWMFKSYAADEAAAQALHLTLVANLHDKMTGGMKLAELEIDGQILEEPVTGWFYSLSFWTTIMEAQFEPV